jgi:AP-3 complex subunit delta-1
VRVSTGLIKALRANKNDEVRVVNQALDECRREISNKDMDVKAAAVLKLVYVSSSSCLGRVVDF